MSRRLLTSLLLLTLCNCATRIPPAEQGQDMRSIYDSHTATHNPQWEEFRKQHQPTAGRPPRHSTPEPGQEREAGFGRLPNPTLFLYVTPHLVGESDQFPVPGYTVPVPLYDRDHFAMPGEPRAR